MPKSVTEYTLIISCPSDVNAYLQYIESAVVSFNNGFGNQTFSNKTLDNEELLDISKFTADAFAGLGFRINIPQTPLVVDLGVNYQMGLMDVVKANSKAVALSGKTDDSHALVYNTISGTNSKEHLRNLTESLSNVKRQTLLFSAGLILKF